MILKYTRLRPWPGHPDPQQQRNLQAGQYRRWVVLMRSVCCLCPFFVFFPDPGSPSVPFADSAGTG